MKPKIGIITSKGGHLYQMSRLKPWWEQYDRFWVTFRGEDAESLLVGERVYFGYYPESRNIPNAIRHLFLAFRILKRERPTVIVSCGAGIAPPFFLAAKMLGIMTIFIEVFDLIDGPSVSGRMVEGFCDHIIVQHDYQRRFYKNAEYLGRIL